MVDLQRKLSNLSPMLVSLLERPLPRTSTPPRQPRQLQRQHRLTSLEHAELVRLYEAGESVTALKQMYSINRETVLIHLKRAGVTRLPNIRKLNDNEVQQAAALYAEGLSLLKTGEKFGVSERTMRRELADAGCPIRPRKGW